jgi:uncharacterized protein YutE (UPF0331/DUF86 family)
MDWLQFFAAVVGHVTWPVVAIVVLIVLRGRLGSLADRLIELTFPGGSIKFDKLLLKGAELVESAPHLLPKPAGQPQLPLPAPTKEQDKRTQASVDLGRHPTIDAVQFNPQGYALWRASASGQILTAYEEIQSVLYELAKDLGMRSVSPSKIMHYLVSEGKLAKEMLELYRTLQAGRNVVAHAKAMPSGIEVAEYLRQAAYLTMVLDALRAELKDENEKPRDGAGR